MIKVVARDAQSFPSCGYARASVALDLRDVAQPTDGKAIKLASGYTRVNLTGEKGRAGVLIHRAVAMAFLPNPNEYE